MCTASLDEQKVDPLDEFRAQRNLPPDTTEQEVLLLQAYMDLNVKPTGGGTLMKTQEFLNLLRSVYDAMGLDRIAHFSDANAKKFKLFTIGAQRQRKVLPAGYVYDMQYAAKVYLYCVLDEMNDNALEQAVFEQVQDKRLVNGEPAYHALMPLELKDAWWLHAGA